jgi:putative ABC transport system ATP-binding protein
MIRMLNISKAVQQEYGNTSILKSIDIEINRGDFVSIMGPSGSGKSTLLNIVGLLDKPTSGEYFFDGRNVKGIGNKELAILRNQEIGFVFQAFMLIPRLSVKENVGLPLLYTNLSRKERNKRIDRALEQVGMKERAKEFVFKLSGGQKQKTAIARAIINNPDLILADEPTGNLDHDSKEDVIKIFKQLNGQGKTVILVTHDSELAGIAHRKLTMKNGEWFPGKGV